VVFGTGRTRQEAEEDFLDAARTLFEYPDETGEALPALTR